MDNFQTFFKQNKANLILAILWLIIAITTMFHHEIWRDEAQVWCLVRDLNFTELIDNMRVEGHPPLWYLLNLPLAKLGLNVISMQILSLILVFCSVLLILFKSPFKTFEKCLIIFSTGMLYHYPIIARNYCLMPVFVFFLAYLYPVRNKKPFQYATLIILLSQAHALMIGFSGILFLLFLIEQLKEFKIKKQVKQILPVILLFFNFIFLFFLFYNASTKNVAIIRYVSKEETSLITSIIKFADAFFPTILRIFSNLYIPVFYVLLIGIIYSFIKMNSKIATIFISSNLFLAYVVTQLWYGGIVYQKIFIFFLVLIFCYWVILKEDSNLTKHFSSCIKILLFLSFMLSPYFICEEIKYNFSGGKQIATYIKQNLDNETIFIANGFPFYFSSISAYLPDKKLYSNETNSFISYYIFDKTVRKNKENKTVATKYYITQEESFLFEELGFKKVYSSKDDNLSSLVEREVFSIYYKE